MIWRGSDLSVWCEWVKNLGFWWCSDNKRQFWLYLTKIDVLLSSKVFSRDLQFLFPVLLINIGIYTRQKRFIFLGWKDSIAGKVFNFDETNEVQFLELHMAPRSPTELISEQHLVRSKATFIFIFLQLWQWDIFFCNMWS